MLASPSLMPGMGTGGGSWASARKDGQGDGGEKGGPGEAAGLGGALILWRSQDYPSSLDLNDQPVGQADHGDGAVGDPSLVHTDLVGQSADSTLIRPGWAVMVLVRPWNSTVKVRGAERLSRSISRIKTPS